MTAYGDSVWVLLNMGTGQGTALHSADGGRTWQPWKIETCLWKTPAVELKSMRTCATARGKGVGTAMLRHLLDEARRTEATRVFLETGSQPFFAPARRLYERHGFTACGPFADYVEDPHSRFYKLVL